MRPSIAEAARTRALTGHQQWAWWTDEDSLRGLRGRALQQVGRPGGRGARATAGALVAGPRGPGGDAALRDDARAQCGGLGALHPVALSVRGAAGRDPGGASGTAAPGVVPRSPGLLRPTRPLRRRPWGVRRQPPPLCLPRGGRAVRGAGDAVRAGPGAPERLADRTRRAGAGARLSRDLGRGGAEP